MQVLNLVRRPSASALRTQSGSDSSGRAIEISCTLRRRVLCRLGQCDRLDATYRNAHVFGHWRLLMSTNGRCWATEVTMVGTRASCHPMPV